MFWLKLGGFHQVHNHWFLLWLGKMSFNHWAVRVHLATSLKAGLEWDADGPEYLARLGEHRHLCTLLFSYMCHKLKAVSMKCV